MTEKEIQGFEADDEALDKVAGGRNGVYVSVDFNCSKCKGEIRIEVTEAIGWANGKEKRCPGCNTRYVVHFKERVIEKREKGSILEDTQYIDKDVTNVRWG